MATSWMLLESRTSKRGKRKTSQSVDYSTLSVSFPSFLATNTKLIFHHHSGHEPATALVSSQVKTDADGYIITIPGTTQTSVKGVFAAGDVQDKRFRQAITSAGSGCMAALEVEKLLADEEQMDIEE
jgi:thioredoxin reductase